MKNLCGGFCSLLKKLKILKKRKSPNIDSRTNALLYNELFERLKLYDKIILYLDHNFGGGCEKYFWDQVRLLSKNEIIIRIQYIYQDKCYKLSLNGACLEFSILDINLTDIIRRFKNTTIDEIYINNIISYPSIEEVFGVIKVLKVQNPEQKVVFLGHDYYSVCPNYVLVKPDSELCGGKCTPDCFKKCFTVLDPLFMNSDITQELDIENWRGLWRKFFIDYVDEFRCFSKYSKEVFENIFPELAAKMTLVPHKFVPFKNTINVAVIGTIVRHKGAGVLEELVDYFDSNNIWDVKIFIIGGYYGKLEKSKKVKILGNYERENLPAILKEQNIDIIFIPSVMGETFCYTAQEAVNTEYPVLCFNIGGQAEQIKQYDKGRILGCKNPASVYNAICEVYKNLK